MLAGPLAPCLVRCVGFGTPLRHGGPRPAPLDGLVVSRRCADSGPLAVEESEASWEPHAAPCHFDLLPEVASLELLVLEDVTGVGDGITEHVARDHAREEFSLRQRQQELADRCLEAVDLCLRERAIVEALPVDRADDVIYRTLLAHPLRQHPSGMPSDRASLHRKGDVAVAARPDVPEHRADDAAADQVGTEPPMLLAQRLPKNDGWGMDRRHRGLSRNIDLLTAPGVDACSERCQGAHRRVHTGPERRLRNGRTHRRAPRLAREPEAAARGCHLEIGAGDACERTAPPIRSDRHENPARVPLRELVISDAPVRLDHDVRAIEKIARIGGLALPGIERGLEVGTALDRHGTRDHVRAEIRQDASAERTGRIREVQDAQSVEHHRACGPDSDAGLSGRCAREPPPMATSSSPPCPSRSDQDRTSPRGPRDRSGTPAA